MWLRHPAWREVIRNTWNQPLVGSPMFTACCKLKKVKMALKKWNREVFGHIQTQIKELTHELEVVQNLNPTSSNLQHEARLQQELQELLKCEELHWRQKSREIRLTSSDFKTKFFHLSTIIKRRKNSIDFLKTQSGEWTSDSSEIGRVFSDHFQAIYSTSHPTIPPDIQSLFPSVISQEDN